MLPRLILVIMCVQNGVRIFGPLGSRVCLMVTAMLASSRMALGAAIVVAVRRVSLSAPVRSALCGGSRCCACNLVSVVAAQLLVGAAVMRG